MPFIIRAPYSAARGRRVPGLVRTEDVMPTVLDLVGGRAPDGIEGRSLVPLLTGARNRSEPRRVHRVAVRPEPLRLERAARRSAPAASS